MLEGATTPDAARNEILNRNRNDGDSLTRGSKTVELLPLVISLNDIVSNGSTAIVLASLSRDRYTFHLRSCPKRSGLIKLIRRMAAATDKPREHDEHSRAAYSKEKRPYLRRLDKSHDGRYA